MHVPCAGTVLVAGQAVAVGFQPRARKRPAVHTVLDGSQPAERLEQRRSALIAKGQSSEGSSPLQQFKPSGAQNMHSGSV